MLQTLHVFRMRSQLERSVARRQYSYTLPAERLTSNSNASQEHGSAPKHANRTGHTNVKTQTWRNFNTIAFYTQKPLHGFFSQRKFLHR
jgi:hypothetical protein